MLRYGVTTFRKLKLKGKERNGSIYFVSLEKWLKLMAAEAADTANS